MNRERSRLNLNKLLNSWFSHFYLTNCRSHYDSWANIHEVKVCFVIDFWRLF